MEEMLTGYDITITPTMQLLIAVVAFLIQQIKKVPQLEIIKPQLPLVAMVLAIGIGILLTGATDINTIKSLFAVGLLSAGAFDAMKGAKLTK